MVLDIILPILVALITDPINNYVVTPIKRQVSYAFKCDSNLQGLQEQVEQLQNKKDRLQHSVDDATRNGEGIFPNITKWLTIADKDIREADDIIQGKEDAKIKCFFGFCPNLKTRYQLSKNSHKKALAIDKLCNEQGLDSISFRPPLQQIVEPSVYSREALPSRVLMLNQVIDSLNDPNLYMVGVYGMGGVGKTTLAKEVLAKARQEELFKTVVMVAVSQAPEIRRIQGEIADFLGMKFAVEEIPGRASQLYKRLENSRVLIILDDLWQKLNLDVVGIPSRGASKDCKIMLTSRNRDLLSSEMGAQKLFSVEALKEEETLSLFEMSVAEAKDPNFHAIATEIAKKCAGLPLLIQIVATELKNKESHVWKDTLNQLSTFGDEEMYDKVYKVLESSYENLPGKEMKSFFLLCSLFGQSNIQIQYLLSYCMGLGVFKHVRTIEDARDKVLTLITKLKAKSLLLDGDMVGFVKMHDVVRDTALNIASRVQHAFIGTGEVRLRDWPTKDCTRISLPFCVVSELPQVMDCPEAELFSLFTEDLCLKIPDSFFNGNKKLKVIDFTGMRMVSLPSSIGLLKNLQTLCLHKCRLDCIGIIGELKHLEFLSFSNSNVIGLPREIEHLTRLKLLDLRNCSNLQVIPASVLSKLCSLEELYVLNSFVRWNAKGNASLMELESLSRLLILEIEIKDPTIIPIGFKCFSLLRRYKISIGKVWDWNGKYERSRTLKLKVEAGVHLEDGIELLLRETEDLYLDGAWGIESIFSEGFPQLKHMHVQNDFHIHHLIKSTVRASCNAFPVLESLYLNELRSMEKICEGVLGMGSFGELRILKIRNCHKLSSLFSFSSAKCLQKLRELEVDFCENMEVITGEGSEEEHYNSEVTVFAQLGSLKLRRLPHLTGFCKVKGVTEQTGLLFNAMVSFPNLTSLEVFGCKSLKHIFTASMAKCLMQLKTLMIKNCELVEEIIQSKRTEEIEEDSTKTIVFPKLDYLSLVNLTNVKRFSSCYSIEFPLLRNLTIKGCYAMENFVGRDSSSDSEEYLFNEMVTFSNLEKMYIGGMYSIKYLWDGQFIAVDSFFKLKFINVRKCSKLSVLFPSEIRTRFQRVESLSLFSCDRLEEIYQRINFEEIKCPFSLRYLRIINLPSLKHIWGAFSTFPNLQSVLVCHCRDMKYVFPASVACDLLQLQQLELEYCRVEVMIAKAKDDATSDLSFQFPELLELKLVGLKEMRSLYEGSHTFHCPKLKKLEVQYCSNIFVEKFIPNLEEMTIYEQGLHTIHRSNDFSVELCSKLKKVTLCSLSEETPIAIIFGFLSGLKSLEKLVFKSCSLEETFILDDPVNQRPPHRLRVKHLKLWDISKLKHITKNDSQLDHILQHLQTLRMDRCHDMMNIAPSSTSLQNLTTLHVGKCNNVVNLVTTSTAKTMVHLIEMKVEDCKMIEEIVSKDGDGTEHDVVIFKKLQHLELTSLPKLISFFCNKYSFSFPLLEKVTIKQCPRMSVFCGGVIRTPKLRGILFEGEKQWEGNLNDTIASQLRIWGGEHLGEGRLFQNVESLEVVNNAISSKAILLADQMQFVNKLREITVRDCDSIDVVFDLEGLSAVEGYIGLLPRLNELKLINLPKLAQLCNKTPMGILDFNKLKVLKMDNCSSLEYALTRSLASCLSQLQRVELKNCGNMETLLIDEEDAAAKGIFNKLENVVLENMPKFSSIYSGCGDLECPSLKEVTARECPSVKAFFISTNVHSASPVFPKLKELTIDMKSIRGMMQFEAPPNLFSDLKFLEVWHCSATATSHVSLVRFLSRLPNLDELKLCYSSCKEFLNLNLEEAPTMPQIRSLTLSDFDDLNKIGWHASLIQSLETLEVARCGKLVNMASSSAPFQNLATLKLRGCNRLMKLITQSMARDMVQLKLLSVSHCKMLMEIVGDGGDQTADEIVFINLKTLELLGLQSLKAFSLTNYDFKFPCLDKVVLRGCHNLEIFCRGIVKTPMLKYVQERERLGNCNWEGDLNTTTKYMYQEMANMKGLSNIKISAFPVLKEKWEGQFPFSSSFVIRRLEVIDCELFSNAIPSHRLRHLQWLKVLIVERCDSLEQVIDLEGLNADKCEINQMRDLNELQLMDLPRLKKVWSMDPQQILSFRNLKILKVQNCGKLTFIFSLSMSLSLQNLQHMEVKNCSLVEHIIMKAEDETMQKYQTIFPSLQSMNLLHLTSLLSFCSTSGVLECPSLKIIEVADCPNVELFASTFSEGQDACTIVEEKDESVTVEDPDSVAALLGNKIVIPGLEGLKVEWKTMKDHLTGNYQSVLLSKLKCIELTSFPGEVDANLPPDSVTQFLELEKLGLSDSLIEEITLDDLSILKDENHESLASLTKLKLSNLPILKHLVSHDGQSVPLFQNLVDLEVVECSSLKVLVPPSVAFHNLTDLEVSKCDGLINLLSASTARSLVQLRKMSVMDCKMMQQIVEIASDGEDREIRFSQLECLGLYDLPCLKSFSSANCYFHFPSLKEMMVTECPNMKNFTKQVSVTPELRGVKTGRRKYDWAWEGSLNNTIEALFMEKDVEETAAIKY